MTVFSKLASIGRTKAAHSNTKPRSSVAINNGNDTDIAPTAASVSNIPKYVKIGGIVLVTTAALGVAYNSFSNRRRAAAAAAAAALETAMVTANAKASKTPAAKQAKAKAGKGVRLMQMRWFIINCEHHISANSSLFLTMLFTTGCSICSSRT